MTKRSLWRTLFAQLSLVGVVVAAFHMPSITAQTIPQPGTSIYLPVIASPAVSPFGIETHGAFTRPTINGPAKQLGTKWIRLHRIQWRLVQPKQGGSYDLTALAVFESNLAALKAANLKPIVIVHDSPDWATINRPYPTSCGAIRADRFADFATFMGWLAARYKDSVQYWELGNEPDIDPTLVPPNEVFGCWGDIKDPYYGGEHYGNMLKAVVPAIKRSNPNAQVLVGGLALLTPKTTDPNYGKPEHFFEGILRAGAGDSIDIVAFHSYPWYANRPLDYDYDADTAGPWKDLGGFTLGKAKFLRTVMAKYGLKKPLFLNEMSMTCTVPPEGTCPGVGPVFYRAQANFIVRVLTRGWSAGIQQFSWYTLDWPGFRYGSLLDEQVRPRPAYTAYQQFIAHTSPSDPPVPIKDYDRNDVRVEAYRFNKGAELVDVLWGKDLSTYYVKTPPKFTKAYDQYGVELTPIGPYLPVNFSAIYIHHQR
jgi:hypothetical protein